MSRIPNLASERGAVLIQTAIAALVMVGFGAFVVDYGALWVARHQAQNAADAGAMAGAIARAYDDFDDPPDAGGAAAQSAQKLAGANPVWGSSSATAVVPSFDAACPPEAGPPGRCVRVDVYRNGQQGSEPLPAWFAPVLGLPATQKVRATARAQVLIANGTNCLRPWAIPDKWTESSVPADPSFKKYNATGTAIPPPYDVYEPPTATSSGTGLRFPTSNSDPADLGLLVPLTFDDLTNPINPIYRGSLVSLKLSGGYGPSVAACNGQPIALGDQVPLSATPPTASDLSSLYVDDPGASWNAATRMIEGGCAPVCAPFSPRLVAIALFDVDLFQLRQATSDWTTCPAAMPCVHVVNIVGFFIADAAGSSGYLTSYPGFVSTEPPRLTAGSSFLKAVTLVR